MQHASIKPSLSGIAAEGGQLSSYLLGIRVYAPIGAWLTVVASLVVWLATGRAGISPAIGLAIGLGVLLVAAGTALGATAKTTNQSRYETLKDWIQDLRMSAEDDAAANERLEAEETLLDTAKGPQWISGEGYIKVSRSLAEVEASLMDRGSVASLLDQAQFDKLRLTGSSVDDRGALLALLNTAINDLTAAMAQVGPAARPLLVAAEAVKRPPSAEDGEPLAAREEDRPPSGN